MGRTTSSAAHPKVPSRVRSRSRVPEAATWEAASSEASAEVVEGPQPSTTAVALTAKPVKTRRISYDAHAPGPISVIGYVAVVLLAGYGVVLLLASALGMSNPIPGSTANLGAVIESIPLATSGASAPGGTAAPTGTAAPAATVPPGKDTFDGLAVNATLPRPWRVTGSGTATIVAMPTRADRSVRLRSGSSGDAVAACRPVGDPGKGSAQQLELDLLLESEPTSSARLVALSSGVVPIASFALDSHGLFRSAGVGGTAATANLATGDWYHLAITYAPADHSLAWRLSGAKGLVAGQAPGAVASETGAIDRICLSPPGGRSGSLLVNNVVVPG